VISERLKTLGARVSVGRSYTISSERKEVGLPYGTGPRKKTLSVPFGHKSEVYMFPSTMCSSYVLIMSSCLSRTNIDSSARSRRVHYTRAVLQRRHHVTAGGLKLSSSINMKRLAQCFAKWAYFELDRRPTPNQKYRISSNRSPRRLLVQTARTPGLYSRPGVY